MKRSASNRIALTFDIEDWYHTPAVTGSDFSFYPDVPSFHEKWDTRYDYLTGPTNKLLGILRERDLRATFFIVADILWHYPGLVDNILQDGHEIGCHGLHHAIKIHSNTKKPHFTPDQFEERTGRAREMLKEKSGQPVNGYRAPGAYFGHWMFGSLARLGFLYDSSVNPNSFFNKTDFDTSSIPTHPYRVGAGDSGGSIMEIPWPSFRFMGMRFPTAGGPFLRFFPAGYTATGLSASLKRGHTAFYAHSIDISDERLPALTSRNLKRPFYFSTSGKMTQVKLVRILDRFMDRWATCTELIESLNNRIDYERPTGN